MQDQVVYVDIIIPVYNVKPYLHQCVDSVLAQNYPAITITLVDDGSSDGSSAICDDYAQRDTRVQVIHQSNQGISAARNAGLARTQGKYVYFLDSDDYIAPNTIDTLVRATENSEADFVFFDGLSFSDDMEISESIRCKYMRKKDYEVGTGPSMMAALRYNMEYESSVPLLFIKRAILDGMRLSFHEGIIHEDELFTFLLFMHSERVVHVHQAMFFRRVRPGSIMAGQISEKSFRGYYVVFCEMLAYYKDAVQRGAAPDIAKEYMGGILRGALLIYLRLSPNDKKTLKEQKNQMLRYMREAPMSSGLGERIQYINIWGALIARVLVRTFSPRFRYK